MHFYERLKELRQDRDLSQAKMADILKIDQSYYSKYERGKHPMPDEHLATPASITAFALITS